MDGDSAVPRKRRRPALACEQCRRRKIRCDQNTPCHQCIRSRSKSETCTYLPGDYSAPTVGSRRVDRIHQTSPPTIPSAMNARTPASPTALPGTGAFDVSTDQSPIAGNSTRQMPLVEGLHRGRVADSTTSVKSPYAASSVQALLDRVQQLETKLLDPAGTHSAGPVTVFQPTDQKGPSVRGTFSKSMFFGQSHWMNVLKKFEKLSSVRSSLESDKNSEVHSHLDKCKKMARAAKTHHSIPQPIPTDIRDYVPPRKTSDELVHSYFRTFESTYRVLHVPSFQREYIQYWDNPQSASIAFVTKLLLVMAIGTCFYQDPNHSASLRSSSPQWIYNAQAWLSAPFEKSRINLTTLQIHCLLLLARQTNAVDGDLVWISAGSLLRTAMQMALHRDPCHLPKISIFHSELRRRLWATVLEILVQSSMDSGGAPLISCQDFDCQPPSNIDDLQIDENIKISPVSKPIHTFTQTSIQIALLKSLPIRLEVAKILNDFRSDSSYDETLRVGAELTAVCRANSLQFQSFNPDQSQPTTFHKKLFDLLTHRFLLALHHPFAVKAKTNPTYYFSRKICLESSLFLLSYSPSPQPLDMGSQDDDYTRLKLLGKGQFRGVLMHAVMAVSLELINQLQEDSSPFPSASKTLSRQELHRAVEDFVDHMLLRIQAGESNVKAYIFLSCVLAQINAMQAGTPVEQNMTDTMRKSAEVSCRLLRERIATAQPLDGAHDEHSQGTVDESPSDGFGWDDDFIRDSNLDFDIPDSWFFANLGAVPTDVVC